MLQENKRRASTIAVLIVCAFTGITAVATAAHWHEFNGRWHGFVHGDVTSDGSAFGRTEGRYLNDVNSCGVGDTDLGIRQVITTRNADLCSIWSWATTNYMNECRGASYNAAASNVQGLGEHYHYAHNYGGDCPRWNT